MQAWVNSNTKFGCESPGGLGCEFKFSSRLRSGANLCAKFDVKSIAKFGAKFAKVAKFGPKFGAKLAAKFGAKLSAKFAAKSASTFAAKTWSLTFYDYIPYVKFSAPISATVSATVSAPVPAAVVGLGAGPWPGPAPVP